MRKKKSFIVVAILIAVLLLGVGYAAISGVELTINGTAKAEGAFDVSFKKDDTNIVTSTAGTTATITASYESETVAKFDVSGLKKAGETVTVTYTIENESPELGATLSENTSNVNTEYFEASSVIANTSLAAGSETTITVTVKLLKAPVEEKTDTITVAITGTPVEA